MSVSLIIRKQKFTIKTGDEQLAMRLRRQVNDELQYSLLDVYKEVMSARSAGFDQDIYIDKITVNLGRCTEEEWTKKLPQMLKKKLEASMGSYSTSMDENEMFEDDPFNREKETAIVTGQHNEMTALFYFLEKGIYPWWFTGSSSFGTRPAVKTPAEIIAAMGDAATESVLIKLISPAHYGEVVIQRMRQRFVQALPVTDRPPVIRLLIALQSDESWKSNMRLLATEDTERYLASFTSVTVDEYRSQLIRFLLGQVYTAHAEALKEFIRQLFSYTNTSAATPPITRKDKQVTITLHQRIKQVLDELSGVSATNAETTTSIKEDNTTREESKAGDSETGDNKPGNSDGIQKKKQPLKKQPEAGDFPEEGIYIDNGGLALLHPFLQPLFSHFGWLNEDSFVSVEMQQRAAVLLYYLHNNTTNYEEYEMGFNKILCGLPLEEVLPADIVLTAEEMIECDQLLDTVVGYWDALKGASREALQESFLRRKAKLCFKEDHWLMQVERNAMDILIDRLPWGFGIIRLPWLKQLIHVEW